MDKWRSLIGSLFFFVLILFSGCKEEGTSSASNNQPFDVLAQAPEGEKIFYSNGQAIRSMRPDGSEKKNLILAHNAFGSGVLPSPDGKIAFSVWDPSSIQRIQTETGEINLQLGLEYLWLVDGTKGIQLTGLKEKNIQDTPSGWSKDGKTLFYVHKGNIRHDREWVWADPFEIWSINIDGTNQRRILDGQHVSVSPDGSTLAIFRKRQLDERHHTPETLLTDLDGSNVRVLKNGVGFCEWAPDGVHLVCFDPVTNNMVLINNKAEVIRELTKGIPLIPNWSWSPDGLWLAYTVPFSIWKLRVDGSSPPVRLTDEDESPFWPIWVP
jgi:dipeptidyl aminopeptidase/acylaminoacyl peptidase